VAHDKIAAPRVIVCEGEADVAFFVRLIRTRTLGQFDVRCPKGADGRCIGVTGFSEIALALAAQASSGQPVQSMLFVRDNDKDPERAFAELRNALTDLPTTVHIPERPMHLTDGKPKLAALLFPRSGQPGNLDSMLLAHLEARYPNLLPHLDAYCAAAGIVDRHVCDLAKARLRCLLAGLVRDNPGASLRILFTRTECPFDLTDACFDWIVEFLRTL
jgi:hypothetical protein